ncbi:hypothetical protein [Blastococcus sp. TF02A-35]|uniref:hypothetical protein n=1 Tax=Blastococcus sp. TF02A-35 TaxID=2559612 RepID=UPI001073433C|nr:hypothetical protein [Blastococcus sp. TF02A_35]TFV48903.1 hypothetical protein E4P43_13225 [Blastococcus sp. TF02A_35]
MAQIPVTQADVQSLGDKIAGLEPQLSEQEKALLTGVIAAASESFSSGTGQTVARGGNQDTPISVGVEGDLPPLRDAFVGAFTPGEVSDAGGAAAIKVGGSITVTIE